MTGTDETAKQALGERIMGFLDRHARTSPDYDPQFDQPDERYTGPDAVMLHTAATALLAGDTPPAVRSDWGSGCFQPYADTAARQFHDELVGEIRSVTSVDVIAASPKR